MSGVVNDKDWGGVFQSDNGAISWTQRSDGLEGRDVFALGQAPDGTMIAGTGHGIFRLDEPAQLWRRVDGIPMPAIAPESTHAAALTRPPVPTGRNHYAQKAGKPVTPAQQKALAAQRAAAAKATASKAAAIPKTFDGSVYGIVTAGNTLLATTSAGLLTSTDDGVTWTPSGPRGSLDWRLIASAKQDVVVAGLHSVEFSADAGQTWAPIKLPEELTQVAGRSRLSRRATSGSAVGKGCSSRLTQEMFGRRRRILYISAVNNLYYDEPSQRMVVTTAGINSIVFQVQLPKREVQYATAGWTLRFARPVGDHLVAATLFDGMVVQPRMLASPFDEKPIAGGGAATTAPISPELPQD